MKDAVWSIVRGDVSKFPVVPPHEARVPVPAHVQEWARAYEGPDTYLVVTPADLADFIPGEVAYYTYPVPGKHIKKIHRALIDK